MDSQVKRLHMRANSLMRKFERGEGTHYIEEAIALRRGALELYPPGHPEQSRSLSRLASSLRNRYQQLGVMVDLQEAIILDREALELRPQGHPDRAVSLICLAKDLIIRFKQAGVMSDLDKSIVLNREALQLLPHGHPDCSTTLSNLAGYLIERYKQLRFMSDLDEAIVLVREALQLSPQDHPNRSRPLINLASCLSNRYQRLRVMSDLDEAIVLDREALGLRLPGHPRRSSSLINLAKRLSSRYQKLGVISDLDEIIALDREALGLCSLGHPDHTTSLQSLATDLFARYKRLGVASDLDEAIVLDREALGLRPLGHPGRSKLLANLATHLRDRFKQSKELKDREELFSIYTDLADIDQTVSANDLSAARAWVRAAEDFQHHTLPLAYETSIRLLVQHLTILPSSPQHLDVMKNLASSLAVDAFAAYLHRDTPVRAVELLEQGRGVFWSQLTRLRSPLYDVVAAGPVGKKLGDEFMRLALLIRSVMDSPGVGQHDQLCHLNIEMAKIVTSIRELPGLSHFLLPSLFSDLRHVASEGPVIIVNVSKYSCDALVILLDRDPVHIPLPIDQEGARDLATELRTLSVRATRGNVSRLLAAFLRKVWDQIVSPIVAFLQTAHPTQSRIWWCPTAEFSLLPLHAAGPFRKGEQNLPELYISSYAPTLSALIRARQRDSSNLERKHFVAIGQANASGQSELPSVSSELDVINHLVGDLAMLTRIEGEKSCIPRVIEELDRNQWVHLACHGLPNRERPFESAFALSDGDFTIQHIMGCELRNSEFAYLSACHTTVGYEKSPDESIHLVSAMLFAGFRSVIGTMWAVEDGATKKIIPEFYKHMVDESGRLDHTRAAFALNKTMQSVNITLDQRVLYVHIGA